MQQTVLTLWDQFVQYEGKAFTQLSGPYPIVLGVRFKVDTHNGNNNKSYSIVQILLLSCTCASIQQAERFKEPLHPQTLKSSQTLSFYSTTYLDRIIRLNVVKIVTSY